MSARRPAIVLATGLDHRAAIEREFRSRYDHDYDVIVCERADQTRAQAGGLRDRGVPVALFAAVPTLPDDDGLVLLGDAHRDMPSAKRICLAPVETFRRLLMQMQEGDDDGVLDGFMLIPSGARDEEFHSSISDLLSDWAASTVDPEVTGVAIFADDPTSDVAGIEDFLSRMGFPHRRFASTSAEGQALLATVESSERPVVRSIRGEVLVRPTLGELGDTLYGRVTDLPEDFVADLVVVGSGPAGLAAAVYGASEGLRTVVIDSDAVGGQAGTSSMIRNYLGFPRGISGMRLTQRARLQAQRFGAKFYVGRAVSGLLGDPETGLAVEIDGRIAVRTHAVVIATGAAYRRLPVPEVEKFVGRGVYYGAATSVARELEGKHVFVVGGGNSAGQAAIHLSRFAASVTVVIRRSSLVDTMSDYLIREIVSTARITVRPDTNITNGGGENRLAWLTLTTGAISEDVPADALMVLLGADPCTAWLSGAVAMDDHGFILAGHDVPIDQRPRSGAPSMFATSLDGVFAVGDVRSGSMKRVASASGEGASVVPHVHTYLADQAESRR